MEYIDYLLEYSYDELPQAIRGGIDRDVYEEQRELALNLREPEPALPPRLQAAFLAATQSPLKAGPPQHIRSFGKGLLTRASTQPWAWFAAAGWLLFLGALAMLLEPKPLLVENLRIAPAPAPQIVYYTDTLFVPEIVYKYLPRLVYDTVLLLVEKEQLVYVHDTLYVPEVPQAPLIHGSRSLQGKEEVLSFLFATE